MKSFSFLILLFLLSCVAPQSLFATATIEGVVTDSVTGLPISGALVEAIRGGVVRYSDTTDPDGSYLITGIEPSNYTLIISAPGYQTQPVGVNPRNNQITIVNIQLVPNGGTIDGTVTDAITTIPISGATIRIFQGTELIQTAMTDGLGFYSVADLAPGNYIVLASASGYQTQFQGAHVQVSITTTVDFALESSPGAISGTVIDSLTSNPIGGALVEVYDGSVVVGFADTDGSGNYTISDLAVGNYTVIASATGYQSKTVGAGVISSATTTVNLALNPGAGIIVGTVIDSSTNNPIAGASIKVFQGITLVASVLTDTNGQYVIEGVASDTYLVSANANNYRLQIKGTAVTAHSATVVNFNLNSNPGTIAGQVIDAVTSNPISGATINVYIDQVLVASAITDPNGNYQIPNLVPEDFTVNASKPNYQTQTLGATVSANTTTIVNFSLLSNPGAIVGQVKDSLTSNPIVGAKISVLSGMTVIGTSLTDSNGGYTIGQLAPGQYTVIANAGRDYQIGIQGAAVIASSVTVVNFALQPDPGIIAGTVTNATNGNPIQGTTILVFSRFTVVASTLTDANGSYSIAGLAPGNYTVVAKAANYSLSYAEAIVNAHLTTIVNFSLTSNPGMISGTVTDAVTTAPIAGAAIQLRSGFTLISTAITDASGNYQFFDLAPDTYTVAAVATGFQRQLKIATVNSDQTAVVNFSLNSNPGAIAGTVTDAITTNPIPNATIIVFQGTTLIDFTITDANGNYTIPGLAPGNYTVLAIAKGYQSAFSTEVAAAGTTTIADFALLSTPGAIAGIVTDGCTGTPVPGTIIIVQDGSTIVGFALTDANGDYSIDSLAPGHYTVTAIKKDFLVGSASAVVTANAITIVNFSLTAPVLPPASLSGCAVKNEFLTQTDLIYTISWKASPSPCVKGYQVFRNGKQIAFVPSTRELKYQDHNRKRKKADVYSVRAVNASGVVSEEVTITLDSKCKCSKKKKRS